MRETAERVAKLVDQPRSASAVRSRKDDAEFLPAVAPYYVGAPEPFGE